MREFYIYGFKSRDEYTKKSGRSYDDERRRLESWLGEYMRFRQTADGKNVFISIDSRLSQHNPLYKAWKAKSFTDGDITLHFILMDIFEEYREPLTVSEIVERVDEYLTVFDEPKTFDGSTIRKKLKEYISEGIVEIRKQGRTVGYMRSQDSLNVETDVLDLFSEIAPCGVIGSFLLDKADDHEDLFTFKHHYITGALDSEILYSIFDAMREKRSITMETINRGKDRITQRNAVPLQVMISAQSGRQYLMAYVPETNRITSFRIDNIMSVKPEEINSRFDELRETYIGMLPHLWGVSTQGRSGQHMEHVEFTIRFEDDEQYIPTRLEREKRCGDVERLDNNTCRFSAEVFDTSELVPWIRTFICRITAIHFSDEELEKQFKQDIEDMYKLYGLEGGEC
ncbi:MAG: WYL domain-containing transcriptional regulator [Lachnospiraceae bacterium]|nr:WYL domain-containing transcriptional regulator [Lachnospiraceae bacterium]